MNQIFRSDSQLKNSKHFHTKYKGRSQDFKLGGRINNNKKRKKKDANNWLSIFYFILFL